MFKKIFKIFENKDKTKTEIQEKINIDDDENFELEFENESENIIKNVEEQVKNNEEKYKPKKERPHYWTEKIYDKSKQSNKENIIEAEIIKESKHKKNNKKNFYKLKQEWIKKGKEYEKFVGKYFENKGYIIKYNGIEKGKKDNSIDIIAIKKEEIIFMQCKNWKEDGKYKISHKDIKAFIGDTHTFINENSQYKNYNIKRLFVISNKILDTSAIKYIKEHQNIIKYKLLKIEN